MSQIGVRGQASGVSEKFRIHSTVFEGPFDLLLHLIDEKKIDLYDVKLSDITDAYLSFLNQCEREQVELGSEFLIMAAALIELKSKMLLPNAQPMDESLVQELEAERLAILNRLFEYKMYKTLASSLQDKRAWAEKLFTPDKIGRMLPEFGAAPIVFRNTDLQKLIAAFNQVWIQAQKRQEVHTDEDIFAETYTVDQCMEHLLVNLADTRGPVSFRSLFSSEPSLGEVIVTFLAILELIRLRRIGFEQKDPYSDVQVFVNG